MRNPQALVLAGLLLCSLSLMGCDCESQARSDFLKEHPGYTVVEIHKDGNDTSVVTYIIYYQKPDTGERRYTSEWAYDEKDGKCVLVRKGA